MKLPTGFVNWAKEKEEKLAEDRPFDHPSISIRHEIIFNKLGERCHCQIIIPESAVTLSVGRQSSRETVDRSKR